MRAEPAHHSPEPFRASAEPRVDAFARQAVDRRGWQWTIYAVEGSPFDPPGSASLAFESERMRLYADRCPARWRELPPDELLRLAELG